MGKASTYKKELKRKKNISKAMSGQKYSEERINNIRKGLKKSIAQLTDQERKIKYGSQNIGRKYPDRKRPPPHSEETKRKMRKSAHRGDKNPAKRPEVREKISKALTGKPKSKEHTEKNRLAHIGLTFKMSKKGKLNLSNFQQKRVKLGIHVWWKGGLTQLNHKIKKSIYFRFWREDIFIRDNWTCQKCKKKGGELHPHHIVESASILNEIKYAYKDGKITYQRAIKYSFLWDIENGITLCKDCHKSKHNHKF